MAFPGDAAINTVEAALDAVAQRQRITSHNIANVATPGFRASKLEFEASLRDAIADGDPADFEPSVLATDGPARFDGNNVDLEAETATLIKSGLHYESLVEALNYKLGLYRTAIRR